MFGKLTLDAFTHSSLIIVFANVIMVGTGVLVVALLTYYRKWGYLYREWFTTVDHKKIGIMYIMIALVFLLRGFIDAAMVSDFVAAMSEAGRALTVYWYEADHAFANPAGSAYDAEAAALAWERTTSFLAQALQPDG